MKTNFYKSVTLFIFLFVYCALTTEAQKSPEFPVLPKEQTNAQAHQYLVKTTYMNYDIFGTYAGKYSFEGKYKTTSTHGTQEWSDVLKYPYPQADDTEPQNLDYMNGFSYNYEQDLFAPEFFASFPNDAIEAKNMVWDMCGMESFAWGFNDLLELNVPYRAKGANGVVELAGLGTFDNRDIQLTWMGYTRQDDRVLTMINFQTFNNPLEVELQIGDRQFSSKGRSHYWGTIWLDVEEGCIDHIQLYEDVVMETGFKQDTIKNQFDVVREMTVTKIY